MSAQRGSASVEHVALAALIGLLAIAGISALAAEPGNRAGRTLAGAIGRKLVCAPRAPGPCERNPLARAYGFPVGKLVRALAPPAAGVPAPVDFRRCRRASCATPRDARITTAGRLITEFTSVEDLRRAGGGVRVSYWLYRPGLPWERIVREGGPADVATASQLRLTLSQTPALVPLETLDGRNHMRFTKAEEPPWRWRVPSLYPG